MVGPKAVLTLLGQSGDHVHHLVATRNLSSSGIGIVHGGYVHPGTRCTISLRARTGEARSLNGKVVKCQVMSGRLHDVGILFATEVNPMEFVEACTEGAFNVEHVDPSKLRGTALFVEDDRATQKLFAHYLDGTGMEQLFAADAAEGLEYLSDDPDIIFVDYHLPGDNGLDFIRNARRQRCTAPMLLVTSDTDPGLRTAVMEAGGNQLLRKPCSKDLIHQAIAEYLLSETPLDREGGAIVANREEAQVSPEMIDAYIEQLHAHSETLANAIERSSADEATQVLHNIAGSSKSHGFGVIGDMALAAAERLGATKSLEECGAELQSVISSCLRAQSKSAAQKLACEHAQPGVEGDEGGDEAEGAEEDAGSAGGEATAEAA